MNEDDQRILAAGQKPGGVENAVGFTPVDVANVSGCAAAKSNCVSATLNAVTFAGTPAGGSLKSSGGCAVAVARKRVPSAASALLERGRTRAAGRGERRSGHEVAGV